MIHKQTRWPAVLGALGESFLRCSSLPYFSIRNQRAASCRQSHKLRKPLRHSCQAICHAWVWNTRAYITVLLN